MTALEVGDPWPADEIARLRQDTPGALDRIHLNNAGASLPPRSVVEQVVEHVALEAAIGGYEAADARHDAVEASYRHMARLLGVVPDQVAFLENATAAYAQALSSMPFRPGDRILTSADDYISNQIMFLSLAARTGVRVERIRNSPEGELDLDDLSRRLTRSTPRLLAITHVPTNSGMVQPVLAAGRLAREADVWYLVDGCQSVGQRPVDLEAIGADFLTGTSRKFLRGPRGLGFMAVSRRTLDAGLTPLFPDLRGADWVAPDVYRPHPGATRFENWEFAYALVLGMGEAARYALDLGIRRIAERTTALGARLRGLLQERGFRVLDRGGDRCAIVTVDMSGRVGPDVITRLRSRRVNASASLRAYAQIDFGEKGVDWALRLSPHYYNEEDELLEAVDIISDEVR